MNEPVTVAWSPGKHSNAPSLTTVQMRDAVFTSPSATVDARGDLHLVIDRELWTKWTPPAPAADGEGGEKV